MAKKKLTDKEKDAIQKYREDVRRGTFDPRKMTPAERKAAKLYQRESERKYNKGGTICKSHNTRSQYE